MTVFTLRTPSPPVLLSFLIVLFLFTTEGAQTTGPKPTDLGVAYILQYFERIFFVLILTSFPIIGTTPLIFSVSTKHYVIMT